MCRAHVPFAAHGVGTDALDLDELPVLPEAEELIPELGRAVLAQLDGPEEERCGPKGQESRLEVT